MRILRDDPLNLTRRGLGPRPRARSWRLLVVLMMVAVGLLVLSRINHPWVRDARLHIREWSTPWLAAAVIPLEPVRWAARQFATNAARSSDIEAVRAENRRLKAMEGRVADLERTLADVSRLTRLVAEPPGQRIAARVVGTSSGAFVRSVFINAGRDHAVRSGYPVANADGLVGRVVEAGPRAARVLLLTDVNSRIPVHLGPRAVRAVMMGDNGPRPRLDFIASDTTIAAGDRVSTSGVGGLFPRGIGIGRVVRDGGAWRVEPDAELDAIEHVAIMFHDTPVTDLHGELGGAERETNGSRARAP